MKSFNEKPLWYVINWGVLSYIIGLSIGGRASEGPNRWFKE